MIIFWAIVTGAFLLLEAVTVAMTSLWFAVGALAALLIAALGLPLWLQIAAFVLVSTLCFALLYPRLKSYLHRNKQATNADMAIGKTCIIVDPVDNLAATGSASLDGKTWTARSADDEPIPAGERARIEAIEGVKLIVRHIHEDCAAKSV